MRVRFWIGWGLRVTWSAVLCCLLFSGVMCLNTDEHASFGFFAMLSLVLVIFSGLLLMLLNTSLYVVQLPLALSFGSTRQEAFWGIQLYRLLCVVAAVSLAVILSALAGDATKLSIPLTVAVAGTGVILCFAALGILLGVVHAKFGPKAQTGILLLVVAAMSVFGGIMGYQAASGDVIIDWVLLGGNAVSRLIQLVGVVLYAVCLPLEHRLVCQRTVKA